MSGHVIDRQSAIDDVPGAFQLATAVFGWSIMKIQHSSRHIAVRDTRPVPPDSRSLVTPGLQRILHMNQCQYPFGMDFSIARRPPRTAKILKISCISRQNPYLSAREVHPGSAVSFLPGNMASQCIPAGPVPIGPYLQILRGKSQDLAKRVPVCMLMHAEQAATIRLGRDGFERAERERRRKRRREEKEAEAAQALLDEEADPGVGVQDLNAETRDNRVGEESLTGAGLDKRKSKKEKRPKSTEEDAGKKKKKRKVEEDEGEAESEMEGGLADGDEKMSDRGSVEYGDVVQEELYDEDEADEQDFDGGQAVEDSE